MRNYLSPIVFVLLAGCATIAPAQVTAPNPTQQQVELSGPGEAPVFSVTVVSRTTKAVNYRHRGGATKVDMQGTTLLPEARAEAKVESKQGYIEIEIEFDDLAPATRYGPEYLTYVMWAITPEGRATNLGEVLLNGDKSKLNVTTELQAFGLIVTAEPYFAVSQPSDVVVMENIIRDDTRGKVEIVEAKYELLKRGQYVMDPSQTVTTRLNDSKVPLELYEARNAVELARFAGADQYAAETYQKAQTSLSQAEDYLSRKAGKKSIVMMAREAVQTAEDARLIAIQRQEEERLAQERREAAEREEDARARAEEQARLREFAEAEAQREARERAAAQEARLAAERARAEADLAAQRSARERADAEAARAAAMRQQEAAQLEAQRAQLAADEANRMREQAEREQAALRDRLQEQLNVVLETRESARGLIVNMSDVLFDVDKATLKPGAREKLAKISGILMAYPGLHMEIEGHTDSTGTDEYNQQLSERRAQSVQSYLVEQGIKSEDILGVRGYGEAKPVATNDNTTGRQQNRRVELVVSGDVIGSTESASLHSRPLSSPQQPDVR
jgi:outer membrane protein OmpA-like peptidoglycan-associated protein